MENHNKHITYVKELVASLTDDKLSMIDFDRLKEWLVEVIAIFDGVQQVRNDVDVLRQDYINRIAGMVKATAVVKRQPDSWDKALTYLESLSSLNADELIEAYRKTSACFRDAFPTSFGQALDRKRGINGLKDLSVYK